MLCPHVARTAAPMAHVSKLPSGKWRAQIDTKGVRDSATRDTKSEVTQWAKMREAEIISAAHGQYPKKTLADAIKRYMLEVSPAKKGARSEMLRLEAFQRNCPALCAKVISEVQTPGMARWRDTKLKTVSPGSVEREKNTISNVFTIARNEWKWCGESPFKGMRSPGDNPPRTRRPTPSEIRRICRRLGYVTGRVSTKQQEVALAFLIALRTAMRASEIVTLYDDRVDLKKRVVRVSHKMKYLTGTDREIPITKHGARLLGYLVGRGKLFTISAQSLDALFRKATASLMIDNLRFHDSRGEALTRLAKKVDVFTLAKISGHKNINILYQHYYRESAEDIAARL